MAEQGASQRRGNSSGITRAGATGNTSPSGATGEAYPSAIISLQGIDFRSQVRSARAEQHGEFNNVTRFSSSIKKLPPGGSQTTHRDGIPVTITFRKFLGWSGGSPIRWVSTDFTPPMSGLTNITIEDEWTQVVPFR